MSHKYLTLNERNKIEVLKKENCSSGRISKILGFHHSKIYRGLKRWKGTYKAIDADKDKRYKLLHKVRKTKYTDSIKNIILNKLNSKWSPEQIASTVTAE